MEISLTSIKTMKIGDIFDVEYTEISLHKRFSNPVLIRKLQPSFDTRWMPRTKEITRVYYNNYFQGLNDRFTSYKNINGLIDESSIDYQISEKLLFEQMLEMRTVHFLHVPKVTISTRNCNWNDFYLSQFKKNPKKYTQHEDPFLKTPVLKGAVVKHPGLLSIRISKEQLDKELSDYMSRRTRMPTTAEPDENVEMSLNYRSKTFCNILDDELDEYMSKRSKIMKVEIEDSV